MDGIDPDIHTTVRIQDNKGEREGGKEREGGEGVMGKE